MARETAGRRRAATSAAIAVVVVAAIAGIVSLTANPPAALQQLMPALDLNGAILVSCLLVMCGCQRTYLNYTTLHLSFHLVVSITPLKYSSVSFVFPSLFFI